MDSSKNYYTSELEKAFNPEKPNTYPRRIKVESDTGDSKWLSLNDESASEMVKFLKEHYNITEG